MLDLCSCILCADFSEEIPNYLTLVSFYLSFRRKASSIECRFQESCNFGHKCWYKHSSSRSSKHSLSTRSSKTTEQHPQITHNPYSFSVAEPAPKTTHASNDKNFDNLKPPTGTNLQGQVRATASNISKFASQNQFDALQTLPDGDIDDANESESPSTDYDEEEAWRTVRKKRRRKSPHPKDESSATEESQPIKCKTCRDIFVTPQDSAEWFERKGLHQPLRCMNCRQRRKLEGPPKPLIIEYENFRRIEPKDTTQTVSQSLHKSNQRSQARTPTEDEEDDELTEPLNIYGGHEERSSEDPGSDDQEGNDSCSSSEDARHGKEDSKSDSENASLPSLQDTSTSTNSNTQFPEYENSAQANYGFMGGNNPLFFERPSKITSHPKASIDSINLPAPHQFDMKDPKVLLRLKTLLNDRPRYQQAMVKAWSRTVCDFNIKSTTQLNAQAAIKWINEFENIRRKEPGLIK